jgi:hypothetical protein
MPVSTSHTLCLSPYMADPPPLPSLNLLAENVKRTSVRVPMAVLSNLRSQSPVTALSRSGWIRIILTMTVILARRPLTAPAMTTKAFAITAVTQSQALCSNPVKRSRRPAQELPVALPTFSR